MDLPFVEEFKTRIGFAKLATMDQGLGVRANWDELPKALSALVKGKRPYSDSTTLWRTGLGIKEYSWQLGEESLLIQIHVSGRGPLGAQRAFLDRMATSSMGRLPYELMPGQIGDLAVYYPPDPNNTHLWLYRNVFVYLSNEGKKVDSNAMARAIQQFMEAHRVPRLSDHLPVVDQVKLSPKEIHVGDEFKVAIVLGKNTPLASLDTNFSSPIDPKTKEPELTYVSRTPLEGTFKAERPGKATVEVEVMDRKTLLSPPLSSTVDVLPAR